MEENKINPNLNDSENETPSPTPSSPRKTTAETNETNQAPAEQKFTTDTPVEENINTREAGTENQEQPAQEQQPGQTYQLPPGYAVDQATGQIVFVSQVPPQPVQQPQQTYQLPPGYAINPATGQIFFVAQQPAQQPIQTDGNIYSQPPPEQVAAQQAEAKQRYGQVINTVEKFLEGEATVADVVKTLYTNTSQNDQLWKGAIVGAAAAVLLTSGPVREAMGKTLGGVFPGLKSDK